MVAASEVRPPVDFVIIGVEKGGTSTVSRNLRKHPDIETFDGEVHFFDYHWDKGVEWYRSQFKYDKKFVGEKTPLYFDSQMCHVRMHSTIPDAKLILLLRNPTKRMFSLWAMEAERGAHEPESFPAFVEAQISGQTGQLARGFYIEHLQGLLTYFPRNQIHIVFSEPFRMRPRRHLRQIAEFIGADPMKVEHPNAENESTLKPTDPDRVAMARLDEIYAPFNSRLFEFLAHPALW